VVSVVRVSEWCQGVRVHCRDTGAVVGESTLLLDFKRLTKNVDSLILQVFGDSFESQMTEDDSSIYCNENRKINE
jgi:hypothetical protein